MHLRFRPAPTTKEEFIAEIEYTINNSRSTTYRAWKKGLAKTLKQVDLPDLQPPYQYSAIWTRHGATIVTCIEEWDERSEDHIFIDIEDVMTLEFEY